MLLTIYRLTLRNVIMGFYENKNSVLTTFYGFDRWVINFLFFIYKQFTLFNPLLPFNFVLIVWSLYIDFLTFWRLVINHLQNSLHLEKISFTLRGVQNLPALAIPVRLTLQNLDFQCFFFSGTGCFFWIPGQIESAIGF